MRIAHESCRAARELGRRVAAAGALSVALVSLLQHAPLWLACLRGAGVLLVLAGAADLGALALGRAIDCDLARRRREESRS